MSVRTVRAAPKASLLIESLRNVGYTLDTALADIVDNSITAGAQKIELFADTTEGDSKVAVLDDGRGMTEDELFEAMAFGCRNPLDEREVNDLGRFGLGLKTASLSQCRKLTIVTRRNGSISCAIWDLDHVQSTDDWIILVPDSAAAIPWSDRLGKTGTLVVWENLDRASGKDFVHRLGEATAHLELVFHRFLAGEHGLKKIEIRMNERPLIALDPFHSKHRATMHGQVERIQFDKKRVVVQTFTLPHHRKVSPAEWDQYAGPGGYLKNQGFYVYREKRLIIHGTWFGLARQAELTKLARVRIDIPNGLDAAWKIDVLKASAQPPYRVRERLKKIIEPIGASSTRVYRVRGKKLVSNNRVPFWSRFKKKDQIVYEINADHPVLTEFAGTLEKSARKQFSRVLELVGAGLPLDALFADMGASPEKVAGTRASDNALRHAAIATFEKLKEQGIAADASLAMMSAAEPFRSSWKRTEQLLEKHLKGAHSDG